MKLLVIGAGTMGAGIAQVAAQAGVEVFLRDLNMDLVEKGLKGITKLLDKQLEKGKITPEERQAVISRIKGITSIEDAAGADFAIEAVAENMEIKKKVFRELDEHLGPEAILGTNTSSLSITEIASAAARPERVIGMHFFNPVQVMALVEVISGHNTSDRAREVTQSLAAKLGKTAITVTEAPGFVVNRILVPMINEAAFVLGEGVATAEEIDTGLKLGANHPMGPLALADLIGLDVCLAVMEYFYNEFGDSKYRPAPLLRKLVRAGALGRKTGRGFFDYK